MTPLLEIEIKGDDKVTLFLDHLDGQIVAIVRDVIDRDSGDMANFIQSRHLSGRSTSSLGVRTGKLRRGTKKERVVVGQNTVIGGVKFGAFYARFYTGDKRVVIAPRKAGKEYLAIPLPNAGKGRPKDFSETFVRKSRAGNLLIFKKMGPNEIMPLFVLKRHILLNTTIPLGPICDKYADKMVSDINTEISKL